MGKLEGKIALITGGNSGIGLATAKEFVNEGAYVFITGRRDAELAVASKEIGRNVTGVQGDVSNLGDLDRLFAQIKREKGKLVERAFWHKRLDQIVANDAREQSPQMMHSIFVFYLSGEDCKSRGFRSRWMLLKFRESFDDVRICDNDASAVHNEPSANNLWKLGLPARSSNNDS